MIIASLHEVKDFGGDITKANTYTHWKSGELSDHVKSALIYSDRAVSLINDPDEIKQLAEFLFKFYAKYTVAPVSYTHLTLPTTPYV